MLQWFKIHTEFLRQESTNLSNNSDYKEISQVRDNLFVSHGNIIVRINGTKRYPILIVYSNATPYRLPSIFPLKDPISEEQVAEIASLDYWAALAKIRPLVKFYYSLRHQNGSGELCMLERDDLDGLNAFYGINSILKRVRDWHAGHINGEYPPDSEEVEFEAHFNYIDKGCTLFYPDSFLNETILEGDFYAALLKIVHKGEFFEEDRYVYIGCFIDGISKSLLLGNTLPIDLRQFKLHNEIQSSHDIYAKPDVVQRLVESRELLSSQWFHISTAPDPFENITDLITIIGNGNFQNGLSRIANRCLDKFATLKDSFYLAVRFPNRKGQLEFQTFKLHKKPSISYQGLKELDPVQKMQFIIDCYDRVEAVETEKMTAETFHQRNSKRADHDILKDAKINLFGVGAVGSEIADCLSKAGIGKISLIDNQIMSAHNAVRHLAGINYVGAPKVIAVRDILQNHNPFVTVEPLTNNLYHLDVTSTIENDSVSVSSVADDNVEAYLNQELVSAGKTSFYVRALRGGKTARIFRVIPGKDACFQCLHLYRSEQNSSINIPDDPDYPTLKNECNNPIRPASAADLKLIASIASRIIIDHLQIGAAEQNHWIWTSDIIHDSPYDTPGRIYSQEIPPHQDCFYCVRPKEIEVAISQGCITTMQSLVVEDTQIETGGVLAGRVDENGNVVISHVSGPGPKAKRTKYLFEKDIAYCQDFLDNLYKSDPTLIYVGEWHSHPSMDNRPSGTDLKSLSEIAFGKNYLTDSPVMIIFSNSGDPSCTVHPAGKLFYKTNLSIV